MKNAIKKCDLLAASIVRKNLLQNYLRTKYAFLTYSYYSLNPRIMSINEASYELLSVITKYVFKQEYRVLFYFIWHDVRRILESEQLHTHPPQGAGCYHQADWSYSLFPFESKNINKKVKITLKKQI